MKREAKKQPNGIDKLVRDWDKQLAKAKLPTITKVAQDLKLKPKPKVCQGDLPRLHSLFQARAAKTHKPVAHKPKHHKKRAAKKGGKKAGKRAAAGHQKRTNFHPKAAGNKQAKEEKKEEKHKF